nr:hypothetical protein [Lachnospiraceae bacterium]
KISVTCTAAGYYNVYACNKGHLHVEWNNGTTGYTHRIYTIKNGKLKLYLKAEVDNLVGKSSFKKNGKKISESKYDSVYMKCSATSDMKSNTAKNRNKYVK